MCISIASQTTVLIKSHRRDYAKKLLDHFIRKIISAKFLWGNMPHILTKMAPVAVFLFFGPIILALCIKSVTGSIFC